MAVNVVFLGKLADLAGVPEVVLAAPLDWVGLLAGLPQSVRDIVDAETTRCARNGELLADKRALLAKDGDEIALLPPVSGG